MRWRPNLRAGVAIALIMAGCGLNPSPGNDPSGPAAATQDSRRTVILTSFVREEGGALGGETGPIVAAMDDAVEITGAGLPFCRRVWEGTLSGQGVVAVAAGSGKVEVALCTEDLLRYYDGSAGIAEVIWSGIAGGTPVIGGLVDDRGRRRGGETVAIGDVCVSHLAVDWDRQYQSVDQTPSWWARPPKPNYSAVGDLTLAQELLDAARAVRFPELPDGATRATASYLGAEARRAPKVFDWRNCGEVTGDMFWHGLREDRRAREMLAEAISRLPDIQPVTAGDVVAIAACNNVAWMNTLEMWAEATGQVIPFAYTRAISNYTHPRLDADGEPSVDAASSVREAMTDDEGVSFACRTAALPVLELFERRARSTAGG